uniref:Agouti domain-containing protein n=1 Tax=Anabas testudineus TaxID=64144 RepID=A0A3Q1JIG4_ANATE
LKVEYWAEVSGGIYLTSTHGVDVVSTGSSNQVRQRPLFVRRQQHDDRIVNFLFSHSILSSSQKQVVPVSPNDLPSPSKVVSKPAKPRCSQITQSCWPKPGCGDPCTKCHCCFFKSICFCRRTKEMKHQRQN